MSKDKLIKIVIIVIVLALIAVGVVIAITLASPKYDDSVSTSDIWFNTSLNIVCKGGMKTLDEDVLFEYTDKDLDYLRDFTVVKANDAKNINEIGIFRVTDGNSKNLEKIISEYVSNRQNMYRAMDYFPEEVEKIDCATVKVFGNYVIYSFLNENDTVSFYDAVENLIKE